MDLKNVNCFLIRGLGRELRQWGKFKNLLEKERRGDFLGKTVQN